MNHSDSERISSLLEMRGFSEISDIKEADLVVYNTCGVRQMAEDRVYGQIHNLKTHASQPVTIILTGCLAKRKDVQKRLKNKVDLFCEIKDFPEKFKQFVILSKVERSNSIQKVDSSASSAIADSAQNLKPLNKEQIDYLGIKPKHKNSFSAYVPIMTGCNNFCAYCVVPYARGREISRPANEIITESEDLVKKGFKEIILLGQNVNSYIDGKTNFSKLLQKINAIPGKFWIQFISNHPKDVTDEMIGTVAKCKKVCENFHLPLQSGSNEIIRKMNRKYTSGYYIGLVRKIKSAYKKHKPEKLFSITSDIIVGFPGETRKQFLETAEIMKKAKYDMVFFGQYSPRPGTAAWNMKDNVSKKEKVRREKYLNEILKKTNYENNKKYVGKILEVLIESQAIPKAKLKEFSLSFALGNLGNNIYSGKTRTMKNVKIISTKKDLVGKIIKAKITKANVWNLEGILED